MKALAFAAFTLSGMVFFPGGVRGADHICQRGGLPNCFQKLAEGERVTVAYFGGSITAGAGASKPQFCYRERLTGHLREQFPKVFIREINAAIGGTGSWLGAFRVANDVLYHGPDLVIVEFAVNDGGAPEKQVLASMEGIVRQIRTRNQATDILFVYTLVKNHLETFKAGKLPERMQWHEKIAEHYGIPSVNMASFAAERILKGELTVDEFAKDGVHPTDRGYALYLEALKPFIARCQALGKVSASAKRVMPKPLCERPMDKARCVPYEWAKLEGNWKVGQTSPTPHFAHVLVGEQPGARLGLKFKGDTIGYFDAIGPFSGDFEFSLDGGPWQPRANFDKYCLKSTRSHARLLAENLDPQVWHQLQVRIAAKPPADSKGCRAQIGFLLVNGEVEDPLKGLASLQRIDAVYAGMDPVKYQPPAGRWQHLKRTMKLLREGGTLRIVMLGDSIVNDTSSSRFDLLLQRLYPKCKVELIRSVRGSTGCWWYKEENRVQTWVLEHKPDLLVIGGISQRDDTDSIREVIRQVRAKSSPDILLMSPAFGVWGEKQVKEWTLAIDPARNDYRTRLQRLAVEEKTEFIDMTGPFWQYVLDSGKSYGWFRRDVVHANERGFQILGRILEKFFAPA